MIDFSEDIREVEIPAETRDTSLWVERYRPRTLADMCLADDLRGAFEAQVKAGDVQNVSLIGPPGTGKTTLALALCNEIKAEPLFVACAGGDGRIDTISAKIIPFCQYSSGNRKVVILDELDSASATQANSFQKALRNVIEQFPDCRFIATANYQENILEPILSRIPPLVISFSQAQLMKRLSAVMKQEGVELPSGTDPAEMKALLQTLIKQTYPDIRALFGKIQMACTGGTLSLASLRAATVTGDPTSEQAKTFYAKVVDCLVKTLPEPLMMRTMVEDLIQEATRKEGELVVKNKLTNAYEFSKGLFLHCLNEGLIKDADAILAISEQLNIIEKAIDKEIQTFRLLVLVAKALN